MMKQRPSSSFFVMILILLLSIVWIGLLIHFISQKPEPAQCSSYHIVVAKYKEDISWLSHMDTSKLHVYDKSGDTDSPFIPLENKGREGSTFLGHIIKHYDNLPDYLIVLQGDPFPHMDDHIKPSNLQEHIENLVQTNPRSIQPLFCNIHEENIGLYPGLSYHEYYKFLFDGIPDDNFRFAAGNQYIIPKKNIQKRPKLFYSFLWHMAVRGDHYQTSEAHHGIQTLVPSEIKGWTLERIFPVIFTDVPTRKGFLPDLEKHLSTKPPHIPFP